MNFVNTGDGSCKLYVQARRIRGKYLPYLPNAQKLSQLYWRTTCISPPCTYSAYTQTLDARPKTHTTPAITDFALLRKCLIENRSPSQRIWSFVEDYSLKGACAILDILVGQTFSGTFFVVQPFYATLSLNLKLDCCSQSVQASVFLDKRMRLCKLPSFPV